MKTYTFEGKTKEAAVELALEELKISEEVEIYKCSYKESDPVPAKE